MVPSGSLEFMFNRKTVLEFEKTDEIDLDEIELEMIDAGLEEIEEHDGTVYVYGDYKNFGTLATAFEEKGIELTKSGLERIPTSPVEFTDEQLEEIEILIDKIEEDDDVQACFTNIA